MPQGRSCIKQLTFAKLKFTPKNLISIAFLATVAFSSVQKIILEAPRANECFWLLSHLVFPVMIHGFLKMFCCCHKIVRVPFLKKLEKYDSCRYFVFFINTSWHLRDWSLFMQRGEPKYDGKVKISVRPSPADLVNSKWPPYFIIWLKHWPSITWKEAHASAQYRKRMVQKRWYVGQSHQTSGHDNRKHGSCVFLSGTKITWIVWNNCRWQMLFSWTHL